MVNHGSVQRSYLCWTYWWCRPKVGEPTPSYSIRMLVFSWYSFRRRRWTIGLTAGGPLYHALCSTYLRVRLFEKWCRVCPNFQGKMSLFANLHKEKWNIRMAIMVRSRLGTMKRAPIHRSWHPEHVLSGCSKLYNLFESVP